MDPLTPAQRRDLRGKAHHLEPVVTIGHHGVTVPVLHEIDVAVLAHELVKVRVLGGDRESREGMLAEICRSLDCAPVQHLGKVLVLWRPNPERKQKAKAAPAEALITRKKKSGPRTPRDPVRERRRAQPKEATPAALRRTQAKEPAPASRRRSQTKEAAPTSRRRSRG